MKKLFLFIITMAIVKLSVGQTNTFPASGNVGIGTTTPVSKLSFNNVDDGSNGADGIGWYSGSPLTYGIYRTPGAWVPPSYQQLKLSWETGIVLDPGNLYGKSFVDIQGAGLRVISGNVGIGTATPTEKLAVNGKIRAMEIKVEANNWPDYVFDQDYRSTGLQDLEEYIKLNKHLPEMPTAAEVAKNGVELGEMNKLLLKKVEELTLYIIQLNSRIEKLEKPRE